MAHSYSNQSEGDSKVYSLREDGPSLRLSPNFVLVEFASKDGSDKVKVHPRLVDLLEEVRAHFGRAVHINSGYRSPEHNRRVGGASQSQHVKGMAADITVRGISNAQVRQFLRTLKPGGIGTYNSFTHVDVWGSNRRWKG